MSDETPDRSEPDPFAGMPLFGDIARLLSQQANATWDAARQLAVSVATGGSAEPNVDPLERIRLEQLAHVAELHVADISGLPTSHGGAGVTIVPVTRGQWATTTLDAWRPLLERLTSSLTPPERPAEPDDPTGFLAPLLRMVSPMLLGMTAGSMVGHLATRAFGQYDLPIPRTPNDQLMVVPANLDTFASEWSIAADDLRLWVCVQEIAVHTV
ncbi:MAG: zinc-dependent metalloprotease, partial [Acidimicrobiia bacterium]